MSSHPRDDDAEPRRHPHHPGGPKKDLGPAASPERNLPAALRRASALAADAHALAVLDHASVLAEEAVHPFLVSGAEPRFPGASVVEIVFFDADTLSRFRRIGAVTRLRTSDAWRLVRRWEPAHGDGALDEELCRVVAQVLNGEFARRIEASVITWIGRTSVLRGE